MRNQADLRMLELKRFLSICENLARMRRKNGMNRLRSAEVGIHTGPTQTSYKRCQFKLDWITASFTINCLVN